MGLLAAVLVSIPSPAAGQRAPLGIETVERVVAVVEDSVILMTELEQYLLTMEARGWTRPTMADELLEVRRDVLDQLINQQLIIQEAAKDTLLEISEEDLEDRVQLEIDGQVFQFGTLGRLQQVLAEQNMTMAVFRENTKNSIRRQLLQERYFAKRGQDVTDIVVTEEEVRAYFDENQALMPQRPPTILFENIQLLPEPSDSAKAEALAEADSVLALLQDGEDFGELASRLSDGPSASESGELGWIRQDGNFVKEFEDAAFALFPGMISIPVETEFGYHIILVERVRGGERRVRQILIQPEITVSDVETNEARAESFATRLRAGETMADLGQKSDTLELSIAQIARTSQVFATAMQNAQAGDVIGPAPMADSRSENGWALARVLEKKSGGPSEFSDVRGMIEERLRSEGLTETVIEGLRSRAYIDIRLGGG